MAKGTSAFLIPVSNITKTSIGSWHTVFVVTAMMNFVVVRGKEGGRGNQKTVCSDIGARV
jgi:hypothetical protein